MQQDREPVAGTAAGPEMRNRISELQEQVSELEERLVEAEKLSTMKSTVLTNLSHEIRTPLAAIVGFASILDEELSDRHDKFLDFIERSGKRMMDALNSILNLSMLEEGHYQLHLEEVSVAQQVEEEIGGLRRLAEDKDLDLRVVYPPHELTAFVDRTAMDRIVHNLIENAIRFTDTGSIEVEVAPAGTSLILRVSDTGCGIRPEFQQKMFAPFAQEDDVARSYEGVGLGLTITKSLVELMNGEINVDSEPGRGTTFTVTVPGVVDQSADAAPPVSRIVERRVDRPSVTAEKVEEPEEKPNVLAVEDNPDMLILLQHLLSSRCEVSTASNGSAALDLAKTNQFDAVLMDINLGENETGVDVMLKIRELNGYASTPFVAVTAYALPGDRERFLQAGFDGYIGKPFTKQQLFRMMDQILVKKRS